MPSQEFTIANHFEDIVPLSEKISAFLEEAGANDAALFAANLGVEELVTNVIKYGYDVPGEYEIQVKVEADAERFRLWVSDSGHHFDPFSAPEPDVNLPAEDRPIGGLGIHLIRQLFDRFAYTRQDDRNIVLLEKFLRPPS